MAEVAKVTGSKAANEKAKTTTIAVNLPEDVDLQIEQAAEAFNATKADVARTLLLGSIAGTSVAAAYGAALIARTQAVMNAGKRTPPPVTPG